MSEDTWEARMAARSKERAAREGEMAARERGRPRTVEEINAANERYWSAQHPWLHGWGRMGRRSVLIGTGVHCVCCGKFEGTTCVAFPEDWDPPAMQPEWPFGESDCPLCSHE